MNFTGFDPAKPVNTQWASLASDIEACSSMTVEKRGDRTTAEPHSNLMLAAFAEFALRIRIAAWIK